MPQSLPILKKVVFIDDNAASNQLHGMLTRSMNLAEEVEFYETAEEVFRIYGNENATRAFLQNDFAMVFPRCENS
jgi:hypothetical protein